MFFVFGMNVRDRVRGLVADVCPGCRDLRWLEWVEVYRVFELYFVPLGKGRLQGSTVRCTVCGHEHPIDAARYHEAMTREQAAATSVDDAIASTTPSLARRLEDIDAIAGLAVGPAYGEDATARQLLERAARLLRQVELAGDDASPFLDRFRRFRDLASVERRELVAELAGYATHLRESRR